MEQFSGLSPEHQAIAGLAFLVACGVFAAYARVFGKKEGAPQPKVQEFAMAGQLADMGPVKELIEGVGLLVQQQIKTNLHLASAAKAQQTAADALSKFAEIYEHRMEDEQREKEIADEVDRRLRQRTTK